MSVIYTRYNAVAVIVQCVGQLLCVDVEFCVFSEQNVTVVSDV